MDTMKELDSISLGCIPIEKLIDELMSRCPHALFIGIKYEEGDSNGHWQNIKGDKFMLRGMVRELDMDIEEMGEDYLPET